MRRTRLALAAILFCSLLPFAIADNQTPAPAAAPLTDADRQHAIELFQAYKLVQAMPLLERLAAERPKDAAVHEYAGFCVLASSANLQDADQGKQEQQRAHKYLLEAKELGDNSNLLKVLLDGLTEDGSDSSASINPAIDILMREAEGAYTRGDLQAAIQGYKQALALDPQLYEAALFAGDLYFKLKDYEQAGEWLARAIQINPDRETAYRYWGDALMATGKMADARVKFLQAVVAEPYDKRSQIGLQQWADRNHATLMPPQIKTPSVAVGTPGKGTQGVDIVIKSDASIQLDKNWDKNGGVAWFAYTTVRALWPDLKFAQQYPQEKTYRHSLKEESEALSAVASQVRDNLKKKRIKKLEPQLTTLLRLSDAGMIQPYVLLTAADEGIAKDYDAYRKENRDKLLRYLDDFVVPKAP